MTIPVVADDLTPEWLSEALGRRITAVTTEPVGVGVGLVGTLFRLQLDGDGEPTTMIAKLAAPTPEGRFVATVINMYGREVGFYSELSPRTSIPHPQCYYAAHDPETQDTVLLMEDVSSRGALLDQVRGLDVGETKAAIRTLAQLHACFWDDPSLADHDFLLRLADEPYPSAVAFAYDTAWPVTQQFLGAEITPTVKAYGDAYSARIPALFAKMCDGPHVLSHADWRIDNLFETPDGQMVAVDWQLVDRSVSFRDLSYFVTQSVNVDDPAGYQALFDAYIDELAANGITPDREWAWEMYRYGTAFSVRVPGRRIGRAHRRGPAPSRGLPGDVAPLHYGDGRTRRVRPAALSITPRPPVADFALPWDDAGGARSRRRVDCRARRARRHVPRLLRRYGIPVRVRRTRVARVLCVGGTRRQQGARRLPDAGAQAARRVVR